MERHIAADIATADPFQSRMQVRLAFDIATKESCPLIDIGILRVGKHFFSKCDERATIHGVENLLFLKRKTNDIDGFEPLFDFAFGAFAFIYKELSFENLLTEIFRHIVEILLHAVDFDSELTR